jgi:hypothetical protein
MGRAIIAAVSVRRCPECGTVNRPTAPRCDCGFVFDAVQAQALGISGASDLQHETPEDQRHYHMHRLTVGWITIAGFVMICLTLLVLFVLGSTIMLWPALASVAMLVKGTRMVTTSRRGLRALAEHDARLPKARLLKR